MKFLLSIIFISAFSFTLFGQKTVSELKPAHAIALRDFLDSNSAYSFLSEELYDAEYLKDLRKIMGKNYKPYYMVGDFNRDKILDFALMLIKEGKPVFENQSEPIAYSHPMAIVVFTGNKKGTFSKAFLRDETNPYVMFFSWTDEKQKRLFYSMDGGLGGTALTPVGKGFIAETIYEN
jgi:hypothetical protein